MAANFFDQFDPASAKPEGGGNFFDQFDPGSAKPAPAGGTLSDLGKSLKAGVQRLPGAVAGLADLPIALATGARPFTAAADALGEATGFQPGKWADETKFSAGYEQGRAAVDKAWEEGGAVNIARAYLANPGYTANQVAESLPGMVAGGLAGRVLMGAGAVAGRAATAAAPARAAVPGALERAVGERAATAIAAGAGEGAVTAGQQMAEYQGEDAQRGAAGALGAGLGTALIGAGAGRVANAWGLETAETALVRAGRGAGDNVPASAKRRILGGMVSEALLQELPQSAQEQMWSNWAEGKPLMEGVARAGTEGALAGGVMGAGANLRGPRAQQPGPAPDAQPQPDAAPLQLGHTPDPLVVFPDGTVGRRAEVDAYLASLPEDQQTAARAALYGYAAQPAEPTTSPGAADPAAQPERPRTMIEALQAETALGAQAPRDGIDFTREFDHGGLTLQDPAETERARAASIDYEATPIEPQWETAAGAAPERLPGLDMPAREVDVGTLELDTRTPSQRLGIDPAAGPLSRAATQAVDAAPAHPGNAAQLAAPAGGASAYDLGGQAFRSGAARQELAAIPNVATRLQHLRGYDDAARQAGAGSGPGPQAQAPAQGAPMDGLSGLRPEGWRKTMLKAVPVAQALGIDTKGKRLAQVVAEVEALDARAAHEPPAPAASAAPQGAAPETVVGLAGQAQNATESVAATAPMTTAAAPVAATTSPAAPAASTLGDSLASQAQAIQASPQQQEAGNPPPAGRAAAGEAGAVPAAAAQAGGGGVQADGLTPAQPAPAAPAAPAPRGVLAKKAQAEEAARADYFAPGNIVRGYDGSLERVLAYSPPDAEGIWSVRVMPVERSGAQWRDVPERARTHSTAPTARELKDGPVERAPADVQGQEQAPKFSRSAPAEQALPEVAQQFKDTERAYGGRAAYDRAKAAGKTKLAYGQWVQVRTPNFKAWFGDWQALAAQQRLDAMEPVQVRVPDAWRGLGHAELRQKMAEELDRMVREQVQIEHPELGSIQVGRVGAKKSKSTSPDPAKVLVTAGIEALIPASIYARSTPSFGGDGPDIAGYSTLLASVDVEGTPLVAAFTVRHQADGRWYYNAVTLHDPNRKARDSNGRPDQQAGSSVAPLAGLGEFSRKSLARVNPAEVSKVVDPSTGEPLVVYHGTGADFSVFDDKKRGSNTREVDARQGFFLSSSTEIASEYAQEAVADGGANIMPAYVSLQNPLAIDEGGRDYDAARFRDYILQAKEQGHDGVLLRSSGDGMFKNGLTGDTVIALRPEQIKSAIGNNGNFSSSDPDIRRSFAGQQAATADQHALAPNAAGFDFDAMRRTVLGEGAAAAPSGATTTQVAGAIRRAYGSLLDKLQAKGLVTLVQTEDEAVEAAAQARAAKTGEALERARASLMASVQSSRSPMKSVEANIRRGREALARALDGKTSVHRAMYRNGLGWVDFVWGDDRKGLQHLMRRRQDADGLSRDQVVRFMHDTMVNVIAQGAQARRSEIAGNIRLVLEGDGAQVVLVRQKGGNGWVLTGFELVPDAAGRGATSSAATDAAAIRSRNGAGAGSSSVTQAGVDIKRSAAGAVEGFFDPVSGQSFLVADGLSEATAPGTLMHEVGIHMAADGTLAPLFERAQALVQEGGSDFLRRVKARMESAGEASAEEAAAYIVTEYENARALAPASVRQWVRSREGVQKFV